MMVKRRELEKIARQQQHKREYDSDEETDQETGTWEHQLRAVEMDITRGLFTLRISKPIHSSLQNGL